MITKEQAMTLDMFYHTTARNTAGKAVRCRANGRCKTWKTRPDDFRLPVKYGLRRCFYLTPRNAHEWLPYDVTEEGAQQIYRQACEAQSVGLNPGTPREVVMDKMEEMGMITERRLKEAVQRSVPKVWQNICYDASELEGGCSLEDAVELCLDANRPEAHGMTAEEYAALCQLDSELVNGWTREALRGYF